MKAIVVGVTTLAFGLAGCGAGKEQSKSGSAGARSEKSMKAGRWIGLAGMPSPRFGLAAATGPDGRVFAIGGVLDRTITGRVDIYDPAADTWTRAPDLGTPRMSLAAVEGRDGRVYVLGGGTSLGTRNPVSTVEAYEARTRRWEQLAPMPTPRVGLAAVRGPDGRIYALGGRDAKGRSLRTVEIYDPESDSWTRVPEMGTARVFLAAAADSHGRILVFGGSPKILATRTVEVYEPERKRWKRGVPLPLPRIFHAATTGLDGKLYVLAGEVYGREWITNEVLVFSTEENAWRTGPRLIHSRIEPAATTGRDGSIYVLGGCNDPVCNGPATGEVYKPSPDKD